MASIPSAYRKPVSTCYVAVFVSLGHLLIFLICYSISLLPAVPALPRKLSVRTRSFVEEPKAEARAINTPMPVIEKPLEEQSTGVLHAEEKSLSSAEMPVKKSAPQKNTPPKATTKSHAHKPTAESVPKGKIESIPKEKIKDSSADARSEQKKSLLEKARKSMGQLQPQTAAGLLPMEEISAIPMSVQSTDFAAIAPTYIEEIASILKLLLRLPEYAEVEMALTISRMGKVLRVNLCSSSSCNSKYIQEHVKTISFPPFGKAFPGEQEHTFSIKLSVEQT